MAGAAFFDLDKTIIAKSSVLAFGKPFYREGLLSRRAIVKSMYAQIVYMLVGADESKMEEVREAMLSLTKGWQQDHVAQIVAETLDEHHGAGRKVVIVSSAPAEVVTPLGKYLGADEVIATRARIDDDGAYTGELEFYAYGQHKADAMMEYAAAHDVDLSKSYAYSDSVTDVPMLSVVGNPVAVNPDKDLAREAFEREWEIRNFARPVRLRDRVPVPPKGPTIAVGTVMAVAGAAVGGYAWWRRHAARAS